MQYQQFEYRLIDGGAEITGYAGQERHVSFPAQVDGHPLVSLGRCAFTMNLTLESVVIPQGVREIGFGAFESCLNLRHAQLPQSLVKMGFRAFARCEKLEEALIPDGVSVIEEGVYNGCGSLRTLQLPAGLTTIGRNAFLGCNSLTEVVIPEGTQRIETQAFSGCGNILAMTIPASVTEIGSDAVQGCSRLETLNLPQSFAGNARDLRVGYGLMVQNGLTVVGSFTYMLHQGVAILEDYEGPGEELVIPAAIEGHPVGGISHMLFLNLAGLKRASLPRRLASVADIIPQGVTVSYRD